jgi:hypothetical protein
LNEFDKYYLDDSSRLNLIKDAIIVFDTSALLDLYFYSDESRAKILNKLIENFDKRLWLPHHVKFEFLKNREKVSHKPLSTYDILIRQEKNNKGDGGYIDKIKELSNGMAKSIKDIKGQLNTTKEKTKNQDKHPYFEQCTFEAIDGIIGDFEKVYDDFNDKIESFHKEFDEYIENKKVELEEKLKSDKVLADIDNYFQVGKEYSYDKLMEIVKEGSFRYENCIPPGYKDEQGKEGLQKYGDLIIWKQIMQHAEKQNKPVILISNDIKSDWIDNTYKNYARIELLIEFYSNTKNNIWINKLADFLRSLNEIEIENSIDENIIHEIEEVQREHSEELILIEKYKMIFSIIRDNVDKIIVKLKRKSTSIVVSEQSQINYEQGCLLDIAMNLLITTSSLSKYSDKFDNYNKVYEDLCKLIRAIIFKLDNMSFVSIVDIFDGVDDDIIKTFDLEFLEYNPKLEFVFKDKRGLFYCYCFNCKKYSAYDGAMCTNCGNLDCD